MKKLNIILHETTIINFPFFWKLVSRYSYFTIIFPVLIFSITYYKYKSQNQIYQRSVSFKYNTGDADSPTNAIANLLGEKTSVLTEAQIIGTLSSLDFQKALADKVSERTDLYELDFSSVNSKNKLDLRDMVASCGDDKKCFNIRMRSLIHGKVVITPDENIENHFVLKSTALDEKTTNALLEETAKLIVESRITSTKKQLRDQLEISQVLLAEKEKELNGENIDELIKRQKFLHHEFSSVTQRINNIYTDYSRTKQNLEAMKTKVQQTKKISKKVISENFQDDTRKRRNLEDKIKNLKNDIWAVEKSDLRITEEDKLIVQQLRTNLKSLQEKLRRMGSRGNRSIATERNYVDKKKNESNDIVFDYNVMKKQYGLLEKDYNELLERKNKLSIEKNTIDVKLTKLKPTLDYVKLLSSKIVQLKLLESTVISDLVFEQEFGNISIFKKTTRNRFVIFSFIITIFFIFISIIIRYLFDDRIYDKVELEKSFEDLSIIGNTPDFD